MSPTRSRVTIGETLPRLDANSPEPLYRQVRAHIAEAITAGVFDAPGRALPSSRYLANEYGVSRNTVELAYQELIAQGIVESRPRSGLYATDRLPRRRAPAAIPRARGGVDWARRLRSRPRDDLPHAQKKIDWHRYPYPFLAGQLDVGMFPTKAWLRALSEALDPPNAQISLRDSLDRDDPFLIETICTEVLPSRGIRADPSQVLVTMGSQQGLYLLGQALLTATDTVAVENPGYLDAWHIFQRTGATLLPMRVDGFGAVLPPPTAAVDMLYLTPSHQHPTNVTLRPERRAELLDFAERRDAVVIEDDYDSEFRFGGRPTRPLKAMDNTGLVVYLGTFSKFLAPGLRLGFIVADAPLIDALRDLRRYIIRHPPGQLQRALALFIASGEYHRMLRRLRGQLKQKWEMTWEAAALNMPWTIGEPTTGGLSLWLSGPPGFDAGELAHRAEQRGVLVEPGAAFFMGPDRPRNNVRIGFASITERAIPRGIALLGEVARTMV